MPKDMAHEPTNFDKRQDSKTTHAETRRNADDTPTECGLTREELRAIVIEMIG